MWTMMNLPISKTSKPRRSDMFNDRKKSVLRVVNAFLACSDMGNKKHDGAFIAMRDVVRLGEIPEGCRGLCVAVRDMEQHWCNMKRVADGAEYSEVDHRAAIQALRSERAKLDETQGTGQSPDVQQASQPEAAPAMQPEPEVAAAE